jgi:ferredoxin, 2Fe-2S
MPQLIITDAKGKTVELDADTGITAMVAIRDAGIEGLLALCGGMCSCATCHVHVDPSCVSMLDEMSEDENELLDGSIRRNEYSRLSCQIMLTDALDGLRLTVANED